MDGFELRHWLMLEQADRIPRSKVYELLREHSSPGEALSRSFIARLSSLSAREIDLRIERCLEWSSAEGNHAACLGTDEYPDSLLDTQEPPLVLFAAGDISLLDRPKILVIGEEDATPAGAENARIISRALGEQGACVATGGRDGVEKAVRKGISEASRGGRMLLFSTLFGDDGESQPVLGRLPGSLAVFGSSHPGTNGGGDAAYKMGVDVTDACLVAEAALRSPVLALAQYALEIGKEVFAIPGSINSSNYRGCHKLIREGACLVENYEDVLEGLRK